MHTHWIFYIAVLALLGASASTAMDGPGNAAVGAEKAEACARCHGPSGVTSNPNLPNIAGQNQGYFIKQMKDFRSGYRRSAPMRDVARGLSDEDIADLAAHYAQIK